MRVSDLPLDDAAEGPIGAPCEGATVRVSCETECLAWWVGHKVPRILFGSRPLRDRTLHFSKSYIDQNRLKYKHTMKNYEEEADSFKYEDLNGVEIVTLPTFVGQFAKK